ncbi:MAG: DUF1549 domain-containing protein [Luteolibacter sp.]|uniref:DUF1549 domain-containing protein n=1 Tax=Luteolibacter sp. TaxID=1962973 RepID=UPI003262F534
MKRLITLTSAVLCASVGGLLAQNAQSLKPQDDPKYLKKAALQIDQYVASFYRAKKLPVPEVTDDATFLRRAFLVSVGRIPTAEESLSFLEIEDPTKREALVDYLLKSNGYSSHMANWAFDLLRITDGRIGSSANNEPYRQWVRNAMTKNMHWNEFTSRLISSKGDGWDQNSAAVGYYTRDRGMPLDNLSNTMRVFLGARMECAQCHDDPFGTTERHDFYELAAFTNGQTTVGQEKMKPLWDELADDQKNKGEEYRIAQVLWDRVYGMSLAGGGSGQIELPTDYQYRDAKPGDMVGGHTPFGKMVMMSDKRAADDGRQKLAEWIVSKTGEQFSSVIANRMWKHVMGKGVYEPVDEFIPAAKTNYPDLVGFLGRIMVDMDYDLRGFQHVLLLTKTFQFGTNPNPSTVEGGDDFHGRKIERLASEQIWDSLITLAAGDPDKQAPRTLDDRIYVGNKPVLVGKKTMSQLSKEVLALKSEQDVRTYFAKFVSDVKSGGANTSGNAMMMGMTSTSVYNKDSKVRASELPSPAPRDHFLYLFGSSDREVVDASSREANVGQVLSLMNGFVQRELVNKSSAHLYKSLEGATTPNEKIRRLYVAILSRPPSDEEMTWMLDEVKKQGDAGYRNIVSALVMSSEFLFLQ